VGAIAAGPLQTAFPDVMDFRYRDFLAPEAIDAQAALGARMGASLWRLRLGAYIQGELAGWSVGVQESAETYHMVNSVVLPAFRRRGVYRALVDETVARAVAAGFQRIYSRHVTTNNAVIVPKLQAGFVIGGLEVSDLYGSLVHLVYLPDPARQAAMKVRSGERRPDHPESRRYFGL
jgi:ribosomal protein S18 acetylase RimI-like enzyme